MYTYRTMFACMPCVSVASAVVMLATSGVGIESPRVKIYKHDKYTHKYMYMYTCEIYVYVYI